MKKYTLIFLIIIFFYTPKTYAGVCNVNQAAITVEYGDATYCNNPTLPKSPTVYSWTSVLGNSCGTSDEWATGWNNTNLNCSDINQGFGTKQKIRQVVIPQDTYPNCGYDTQPEFYVCVITDICPDNYILDVNGKCVMQTTPPTPPEDLQNQDCEDGGGYSTTFYQSTLNSYNKPAETISDHILNFIFDSSGSCITYSKTNIWRICCPIDTTISNENVNSGYLPSGCITISREILNEKGNPSASYDETLTTPWSETNDVIDIISSSDYCPWVNNEFVDTDGDGIPNHKDPDIDGDGIPNGEDDDVDGDGIPNGEDRDVDGDNIPNEFDLDIDGDFIPNWKDPDMDGDGLINSEDDDVDGDGIPNDEDETPNGLSDVDDDGIPDEVEDEEDIGEDNNIEEEDAANPDEYNTDTEYDTETGFNEPDEPDLSNIDTSEINDLVDNYGIQLKDPNCIYVIYTEFDFGVVEKEIDFCQLEAEFTAAGYILVAYATIIAVLRILR